MKKLEQILLGGLLLNTRAEGGRLRLKALILRRVEIETSAGTPLPERLTAHSIMLLSLYSNFTWLNPTIGPVGHSNEYSAL